MGILLDSSLPSSSAFHYIQALVETGLIGLLLFLGLLLVSGISIWRGRKKPLAPALGAVLLFMAAHGAVDKEREPLDGVLVCPEPLEPGSDKPGQKAVAQGNLPGTIFTAVEDGLKLFRRSPVIGLGLGAYGNGLNMVQSFYYFTYYAHNHYIQGYQVIGRDIAAQQYAEQHQDSA